MENFISFELTKKILNIYWRIFRIILIVFVIFLLTFLISSIFTFDGKCCSFSFDSGEICEKCNIITNIFNRIFMFISFGFIIIKHSFIYVVTPLIILLLPFFVIDLFRLNINK